MQAEQIQQWFSEHLKVGDIFQLGGREHLSLEDLQTFAEAVKNHVIKRISNGKAPTAIIYRNQSGQIVMCDPDGDPFDVSQHVGTFLFGYPAGQVLPDYGLEIIRELLSCAKPVDAFQQNAVMRGKLFLERFDKPALDGVQHDGYPEVAP